MLDLLDGQLVDGKIGQTKAISKDTTWAKIFECIRRHASSLHSALTSGWKCNCMVPHVGALQLQERDGGDSSARFTMSFVSSTSTKQSSSFRRVVITVKDLTNSKNLVNARPQPTPLQDWYLDKLIQNIESESPHETKKKSPRSSNSSSIFSKYSSGISVTKSDSLLTVSSVQSGNRTEVLVEESHHK
jgi:hypothetical protein